MKHRSPGRLAPTIAAASLLLALAACAPSEPEADAAPVFALDRRVTDDVAPVDPDRVDVLPAPALRSLLQALLTEHTDLSILVMRQAVEGDDVGPTVAAITDNTDRLTLAIGLVYGPEGAEAFDQLWTNHIQFFDDYAAAIRDGDDEAAAAAIAALDHYEQDFSSYLDAATSGEADFHAVLHVLSGHVDQLLGQVEAWERGAFEAAHVAADEAHVHMDVIAAALATGIAVQQPAAFPGAVDDPAASSCAARQLAATRLVAVTLAAEAASDGSPAQTAGLDRAAALRAELDADAIALAESALASVGDGDAAPASIAARRIAAGDAVVASLAADPDCAGVVVG